MVQAQAASPACQGPWAPPAPCPRLLHPISAPGRLRTGGLCTGNIFGELKREKCGEKHAGLQPKALCETNRGGFDADGGEGHPPCLPSITCVDTTLSQSVPPRKHKTERGTRPEGACGQAKSEMGPWLRGSPTP